MDGQFASHLLCPPSHRCIDPSPAPGIQCRSIIYQDARVCWLPSCVAVELHAGPGLNLSSLLGHVVFLCFTALEILMQLYSLLDWSDRSGTFGLCGFRNRHYYSLYVHTTRLQISMHPLGKCHTDILIIHCFALRFSSIIPQVTFSSVESNCAEMLEVLKVGCPFGPVPDNFRWHRIKNIKISMTN